MNERYVNADNIHKLAEVMKKISLFGSQGKMKKLNISEKADFKALLKNLDLNKIEEKKWGNKKLLYGKRK